jgi:hypothetical protein
LINFWINHYPAPSNSGTIFSGTPVLVFPIGALQECASGLPTFNGSFYRRGIMEHALIELCQDSFIRKLKGAALSVFLVLYASAASLGVSELVSATGWCRDQVRRALRQLLILGWVEQNQRYHGWELVDQVRQSLSLWLQTGGREASSALTTRSRRLEVVNLININNNTTSRDSDSAGSASTQHLPQIERVLNATDRLFGEPVWGPPERYQDPWLLLAWIARAYQLRERMDKPARVVFRNLQKQRFPPQRYLDDPLRYLPQDFLAAAGLALPPGEESEADEGDEILSPQEAERAAEPHDPSLELLVGPQKKGSGTTLSAARAWGQALALLEPGMPGGMPAGLYTRGVAPAVLLRYKPPPEPGVPAAFSVQVPSEFLRAVWLDRLVPALCRQLSGLCAGDVAIQVHAANAPPGGDEEARSAPERQCT